MAGSSNFLVFDQNKTNMMTDANYSANSARVNGVDAGQASSILHNKIFYQTSIFCAAFAQALADKGYAVSDSNFNDLVTVLANVLTSVDNTGSLIKIGDTGWIQGWNGRNYTFNYDESGGSYPVLVKVWIADDTNGTNMYQASDIWKDNSWDMGVGVRNMTANGCLIVCAQELWNARMSTSGTFEGAGSYFRAIAYKTNS
jgi:hypothetical protein